MRQVGPCPGEHRRGAGGEPLRRNSGSLRALSNAYKLFRSPCAALESDLHKSLECLTEFLNAPAPLGTAAVGAAGAGRAAATGPKPGGRHRSGRAAGPAARAWSPGCFCGARWAHAVCLWLSGAPGKIWVSAIPAPGLSSCAGDAFHSSSMIIH